MPFVKDGEKIIWTEDVSSYPIGLNDMEQTIVTGTIITGVAAFVTAIAAWITHVVVCIKTTSWILLVFGIIVPPIGLIHGVGSWFGWF